MPRPLSRQGKGRGCLPEKINEGLAGFLCATWFEICFASPTREDEGLFRVLQEAVRIFLRGFPFELLFAAIVSFWAT
jgi:hypothetical protein